MSSITAISVARSRLQNAAEQLIRPVSVAINTARNTRARSVKSALTSDTGLRLAREVIRRGSTVSANDEGSVKNEAPKSAGISYLNAGELVAALLLNPGRTVRGVGIAAIRSVVIAVLFDAEAGECRCR